MVLELWKSLIKKNQLSMKDNGSMVIKMDMENKLMNLIFVMKDSGKKVKKMGMGKFVFLMEIFIKDNLWKDWKMVQVHNFLEMVISTQEAITIVSFMG